MKFYRITHGGHKPWAQTFRIMKLTVILLFGSLMAMSATTYSQNTKLNLSAKNSSLIDIFRQIEDQSEFYFYFKKEEVKSKEPVSVELKDALVTDILDQILDRTGLEYKIIDRYIVVKPKGTADPEMTMQQERKITGKVTDQSAIPLPGVSVVVKGTTKGVITDNNGNFSIDLPDDAKILTFSFVGMRTQEVIIVNKAVVNITMTEEAIGLEEIVAIGYGTQKKGSVLGAITAVRAKDIQDVPANNLSNALAGRMAGVTIMQSGGKPGMASSIQIRAIGTMSGATEPLYVIDGIIVEKFTFDGLDVSEVESISILKDAASAAVYGARAANGVVLVTTKNGKAGKPVISYSGTVGIDTPTKIPETQTGFEQATLINDNLASSNVLRSDPRYYTQDELDYFKTHNYDWIKEAWKAPTMMQHTLNVSGGSEKVKYFFGGAIWQGTGSFNNLDFKKYNIRMNLQAEITKELTASLNINTNTRNDLKPYWRYDSDSDLMPDLYKALLFRPSMIPPYMDGKPVGNNVDWHPIEITTDKTGYNKKKFQEFNAIFSLDYKVPFVKGLSLKATYNKFTRNTFIKQFSLPYTLYTFKTIGEHNHILTNELVSTKIRNDGEFLFERYIQDESYQLNGYITYARDFGRHSLNALLVYEQSEGTQDWFSGKRNYFISSSIDQMFGGSSDPKDDTTDGSASESGRESYVGRFSYNYDQKYLLESSFRFDGSQRFAPGKRWGFFPSVSMGWRISKESFFQPINWINDLKIRASAGLLGNDAIASWQWYQAFNIANPGAVLGSATTGIAPGAIANPDLTWEKSVTCNIGADARLFDAFTLSLDAFKRHTYDIFGSRQLTAPATFGATLPKMNYGVMDSHGFEIELGYENKIGNNLKYYARGNFAYAVNKIIKWDEVANIKPYKSIIGQPNDLIWGYHSKGIIRTQEQLDALPADYRIWGQVPTLGMLDLQDYRSLLTDEPDNKVDANDDMILAKHSTPPFTYGFSLGTSWKGISLDIVFQGLAGYYTIIDTRSAQITPIEKAFSFWNDHWTPENPNASMPRPRNDNGAIQASDFWLRNNSFLRCKNLTLSYDLPKKLINKINLEKVRVYFIGTNLFLLEDHIKWKDPEASSLKSYPLMKNLSLGINITI